MTQINTTRTVHPAAKMYADEYCAGHMDRREFLTRATALGFATKAAYGLIVALAHAIAAGHAK